MSEPKGPIYDDYEDIFRRHYEQNYDRQEVPFGRVAVAYSHGFNLAADEQYADQTWVEVEEEARQAWEEREAGAWEEFEEAIKYAWKTAKDAMSD